MVGGAGGTQPKDLPRERNKWALENGEEKIRRRSAANLFVTAQVSLSLQGSPETGK